MLALNKLIPMYVFDPFQGTQIQATSIKKWLVLQDCHNLSSLYLHFTHALSYGHLVNTVSHLVIYMYLYYGQSFLSGRNTHAFSYTN